MKLDLQFSGGMELLFDNVKSKTVELPMDEGKATMRDLLPWIRDNLLKERPDLFLDGETVRPGILVLVNDADWELEGELDCVLRTGDEIYKAGVLGATGTVGQRFVALLHNHPQFTVHALGASTRSAGKPYARATNWKLDSPCPDECESMVVEACPTSLAQLRDPQCLRLAECDVVFSGLDSSVATEIESAFADAGIAVFSNAKNFRMHDDHPIIVPPANGLHLGMLPSRMERQQSKRRLIATNSNCSTVGLVVVLKALQAAFGPVDRVMVTTMQAVSGAGYPGLPVLDVFDNVVPYISGEEDKIETEPLKILGSLTKEGRIQQLSNMRISAATNRVPVLDGHTLTLSLSFAQRPGPDASQVRKVLRDYVPEGNVMQCHSAPDRAIHVFDDSDDVHIDRPQPRLDRNRGKGMTVSVGRIRPCPVLDLKMVILSHNTVLGAAGGAVWAAEAAIAGGYL
ncbi:aspartate-semialdehyde dehydrogenase [Sorochytrium milnesiophthora]